ncbi:alpha/beta hydrolase [Marivita geojedonensis]|uniref:Alpha/beta hydrolase n=1 Tax=Marivita geojedonensis TaxID=1123756 RepID=A0A1X4NQG3_9RHOB|nr:alpha/beta fold hydrolase [Marivita geojedonensis]OSQ53179.1 alpha/beta hydrolase [Marivita geojedonensis]PRY81882.1 serine aminopeptidase S33 family [Marivita geojedonensis]
MARPLLTYLAILIAGLSILVLEVARTGVTFTDRSVGPTPVTTLARDGADGPNVVIAHGFAGSREMMQGYGLTLAQAGYRVHMFDFEGHGAHPEPMSGDVTRIEGTTRLLMDQTRAVIDDVADGTPVALLGHSMATDVLIRVAMETDTGPLVLLSAFSQAVTADQPKDMLLISGQWEPHLREFGVDAVQMVDPDAQEGETVQQGNVIRAAIIAPWSEHVAILQSRAGRLAALDWLNRAYDRDMMASAPPTGWAFLALMASITVLASLLVRLVVPEAPLPPSHQPGVLRFLGTLIVPAVLTPFLALPLDFGVLPVLVADYLAIHLGVFGLLSLTMQRWLWGPFTLGWTGIVPFTLALVALLAWGIGVFGFALDRYGANFFPIEERLPIIAALVIGAIPFMVADAQLVWKAPLWRRIAARVALLVSLGIAVALDLEGLFFLLIIAPVIILFFFVHGAMGRAFGKRAGPLLAGIALGIILAWALGVSFPMFAVAGGGT